ncbi:MAG: MgtC/SapB family protein [Eubacterium sp.]|nr:MgtC/SapB family protein [Eubacterium sp.]
MNAFLTYIKDFNFLSVCLRLLLGMAVGGVIGYGRSKKKKAAGLRTFMIVSIGAALTMLPACYEYRMLCTSRHRSAG